MNIKLFCCIVLLVSIPCFATTYTWNNGSGDHNFVRGSNWTGATDSTVFTTVDEFRIDLAGDSLYSDLFSDAIGNNLRVGYGATGELHVTGGVSNFNGSFMAGRGAAAKGYVYISGGEITFLNSYMTVGESGFAHLEISDGTVRANRFNMATKELATSQSEVVMTGGLIDLTTTFACGTAGSGNLSLSGGQINVGTLLSVGVTGQGLVSINGSAGQIQCGQLAVNSLSTIRLNIDGTTVFGNPITVTTSDSTLSGYFDPNFISDPNYIFDPNCILGKEHGGLYVAVAALQNDIQPSEPNLSPAALDAGWTSQTVNTGAGQAVLLSYPHSGNNVIWTSGSSRIWSVPANWNATLDSDDVAVIDLAGTSGTILNSIATCSGLVVGSTANGSLDFNNDANAAFGSLLVADKSASSGSLAISDGTLSVASTAIVGSSGNASFTMNGGAFYAGNLIAALNAESTADIQIANNAIVAIDGVVGLNAASKLSISGCQTNVRFGTLTTAQGSELGFVLEGAQGVGNGLVVNGNVVLAGKVQPSFVNGIKTDGTYTLLRSKGKITDKTGGNLVKSMPGSIVSYELVDIGGYHTLQITIYSPATCQEVINAGLGYSGDINEDCTIDILDFAEMASQWLLCNDPQGGVNCSL